MASSASQLETIHLTDVHDMFIIVCVDCDARVFEWSTPHLDRCWQCAESADLAAGR